MSTVAALQGGLGLLSMAAAVIHFAVIDQHFEEYWLYGSFFVVTATAQLGWALLVVRVRSHLVLVTGAILNAFAVGAWAVTRTVGSLIGPMAATRANVGFGDLVSTALEVLIVLGTVLLISGRPLPHLRAPVAERLVLIAALLTLPLVTLSLYSAVGGAPFVSKVG